MENFGQMLHDWANFFSALAQVSGALVGLVFLALTFKPKALVSGGDPLLSALARQTFADFVLLLLVSMLMLVPHLPADMAGWILLGMTATGVGRILGGLFQLRAHLGRLRIVHRLLLSILGHVLLATAGIELIRGEGGGAVTDSWLLSGVAMLLLAGCRSAWLLVVHEGPSQHE